MTNPNERIHEAFREYLRTTALRRDGGTGSIIAAGRLSENKRRDLLAALDVTIGYYREGRLSSPDPEYLGRVFWNALVTNMDNGTNQGDWSRAREYPTDRRACVQIGEWLVANRHLADEVEEQATAPVLMVGDPVWIRSLNTLGEYRGRSGTLATAIYRRDGETYLTAQVSPDDLMPMRGVAMTLIPDGPRSSYSLDYALRENPQEVTFSRWYSEAQGLARDQAVYVAQSSGDTSEFIPAWRLQPAVAEALRNVPPLLPVNENVLTIDGVEYVRKATVDADMETLTRTLHRAADSNGLCAVYDRTVVQVDEATTFLKMGAVRGRYRAVVTETYTITREVDVPNEHRSDDHARSTAEVTNALRLADIPGATGLLRSAVTVDRVIRS